MQIDVLQLLSAACSLLRIALLFMRVLTRRRARRDREMARATLRVDVRRLKSLRALAGLTVEVLARRSHVSKRQIERIEGGSCTTHATLCELARVLGVTAEALTWRFGDGDRDLAAIASARNASQMSVAFADLPYTFDVTSEARRLIPSSQLPMLCTALVQLVDGDGALVPRYAHSAGILATILSTRFLDWRRYPSRRSELDKLRQCCVRILGASETRRIALVEPLVFSLAAYDRARYTHEHEKFLRVCIEDPAWHAATTERYDDYYGSREVQLEAIARHVADRCGKKGLLVAHDLPHLVAAAPDLTRAQRARATALLETTRVQLGARSAHALLELASSVAPRVRASAEPDRI